MTAKERQLWYWRKEMESCHRLMRLYPPDSEDYQHWEARYKNAVRAYKELSGLDLKPQESR